MDSATVIGASLVTWVAGLAAGVPATATRPASTSSAACSRDRARPRRTNSTSRRALVVTRPHFPENLTEPAVHGFEHRRMLVNRCLVQPAQASHRFVHPFVTSWWCHRWVFPIHLRYPPRGT